MLNCRLLTIFGLKNLRKLRRSSQQHSQKPIKSHILPPAACAYYSCDVLSLRFLFLAYAYKKRKTCLSNLTNAYSLTFVSISSKNGYEWSLAVAQVCLWNWLSLWLSFSNNEKCNKQPYHRHSFPSTCSYRHQKEYSTQRQRLEI